MWPPLASKRLSYTKNTFHISNCNQFKLESKLMFFAKLEEISFIVFFSCDFGFTRMQLSRDNRDLEI